MYAERLLDPVAWALAALIGTASACAEPVGASADVAADSGPACPPGKAVNKYGLGKPCTTDADCNTCPPGAPCPEMQKHFFCPRAHDPKGWDFCVKPAFTPDGLGWPTCGSNARKIPQKGRTDLPALCVPASCGDVLFEWPAMPAFNLHCDTGGPTNATGLGKPCQTMNDCEPFNHKDHDPKSAEPSAWTSFACPMVLHDDPSYLNFCSPLCGQDSDCGPDAFCWWHKDVKAPEPQDAYPHGACVPRKCCKDPACPLVK